MIGAERNMPKPREYGQYIVADPNICHGKLTFRGTRIFVSDVLEQVAEGMDWAEISREWRGRVTKPAIAEAIRVAADALFSSKQKTPRRRIAG
jgi:uncharacterized protein (DUF433 family)